MKPETKFKIKTFLWYLIFEPIFNLNNLPNLRTMSWIFIIVTIFLRNIYLQLISILFGILLYIIAEYQSGRYIHQYRKNYRRYKKTKTPNTQLNIGEQEEGKGSGESISPSLFDKQNFINSKTL